MLRTILKCAILLQVVQCDFLEHAGVGFHPMAMPKLTRNLILLKEDCGEVCDTSANVWTQPGQYFDQVTKDFDCQALFDGPLFDKLADSKEEQFQAAMDSQRAPTIYDVPKDILKMYSYDERVSLMSNYMDQVVWVERSARKMAAWSPEYLDMLQEAFRNGQLNGGYGIENVRNISRVIQDHMLDQVKNGHVLVIGSQSPWVEAILLELGAGQITTLEYGEIASDHPKIKVITPSKLKKLVLSGNAPQFDAMVTFSSLEHGGLGRYGDSLNPWADLITMARTWCLTRPGGRALVGVPAGYDGVYFNSNKIYGPLQFSHLFANWHQVYSEAKMFKDGMYTPISEACPNKDAEKVFYCYEPLTVLEKPQEDHTEL